MTDEGVATAHLVTFDGLAGDDTTPFASYSENGFSVTVTDGQWTELHTGTGINGSPAPAIEGGATVRHRDAAGRPVLVR